MQQMHCNALFCHDIGFNGVYYDYIPLLWKGSLFWGPGPYMDLFFIFGIPRESLS